jgi:hypothetical protein
MRYRMADAIVQELVDILALAAQRGKVSITSTISSDANQARAMEALLQWIFSAQNPEIINVRERIAQWMLQDDPAVAAMKITWCEKLATERREATVIDMAEFILDDIGADQLGPRPDEADDIAMQQYQRAATELAASVLLDPSNDPVLVEWIGNSLPHLSEKTIRKMLRSIRENGGTGIAIYPEPVIQAAFPKFKALRINDDLFIPPDTENIQECSHIFEREWLTSAELQSRIVTMGYNQQTVNAILENAEGLTAIFETVTNTDDTGPGSRQHYHQKRERNDQYEVINAYFHAVNEENILGKYHLAFSAALNSEEHNGALTPQRILDYQHGLFPFVLFNREALTKRITDSRGIPELASTDQGYAKRFSDLASDNAQLATIPPYEVPAGRPDLKVVIAPLAQNKVLRPGEISPIKMPDFPRSALEMVDRTEVRIRRYFGLKDPNIDPEVTFNRQQNIVSKFLAQMAACYDQALRLCQQYMSDQSLLSITGQQDFMPRTREAIQGNFSIQVQWSVRENDMEYQQQILRLINEVIAPLDSDAVINRGEIVAYLFNMIDPVMAARVVQTTEAASMREIEDEQGNIAKILTGNEPPMKDRGQNAPLRLQVLNKWAENNPEIASNLPEKTRAILQARMENLTFQQTQEQNKIIGRYGAASTQDPV